MSPAKRGQTWSPATGPACSLGLQVPFSWTEPARQWLLGLHQHPGGGFVNSPAHLGGSRGHMGRAALCEGDLGPSCHDLGLAEGSSQRGLTRPQPPSSQGHKPSHPKRSWGTSLHLLLGRPYNITHTRRGFGGWPEGPTNHSAGVNWASQAGTCGPSLQSHPGIWGPRTNAHLMQTHSLLRPFPSTRPHPRLLPTTEEIRG